MYIITYIFIFIHFHIYLHSIHNIFIFFPIHRNRFITESADKLGLEYFIPCHGGIHCVTLSLSELIYDNIADSYMNIKNGKMEDDKMVNDDIKLYNKFAAGSENGFDDIVALSNAGESQSTSGHVIEDIPLMKSLTNISIVAGHFFWDIWQQLPSASIATKHLGVIENENRSNFQGTDSNKSVGSISKAVPPCLIMGRHPFERAISYYYQRCYVNADCVGYGRRFNDLSSDELYIFATSRRQGDYLSDNKTIVVIDEGMEDAACRALANEKATTGLIVGVDEIIIPPPLSDEAISSALNNVEKCVVGILERWDETKEVLGYWFPWMDFSEKSNRRKMFLFSGKETPEELKPELISVLLQVSKCDMLLYEKMLKLFEVQLSVIKIDAYSTY